MCIQWILCIPPCNIESQCMSRWCCFTMYLWWSFTVYSLCIPPCNIESQCMFPWYCTDPSPGQSLRGNVFVSPFLLPKRNINDNLKPFKHYQKYNVPRSRSIVRWLSSLTDQVKMSVRGGIKNCFFLLSVKRGRGGLGQSKKSLSENAQIFLTKGFYQIFGIICQKMGALNKKKW